MINILLTVLVNDMFLKDELDGKGNKVEETLYVPPEPVSVDRITLLS